MDDKLELAGKSPFVNSVGNNSQFPIRAIFDINKDSQGNMEDFGRESLGILNLSHQDLGRESLSFLLDDFGRESLGIINLDVLNQSLSVNRDTLGVNDIVLANVISNSGSKVGPISINICDCENLPEESVSKTTDNNNLISILNTAFLQLPKVSVGSSVFSFNSASLNSSLPSRITSASSINELDVLNDAFANTDEFFKRLRLFKTPSVSSDIEILSMSHPRIKSLPTHLEIESKDFKRTALSVGNKIKNSTKEENIYGLEAPDVDVEFNDSVFIEAKHIAFRIQDGSFLEADEAENDMLDSIRQPEDFVNESAENEEPIKFDSETVFKTVDKLFSSAEIVSKNLILEPDIELRQSAKLSDRDDCSQSNSKFKDALEIISTLSEMSNNNLPEEQKSHCQHLLSSLAEIVLSSASASTMSRSCILDDSGHSSIDSEPIGISESGECYEVLDLRKNSSETKINQSESDDICVPLDLSLKSKSMCNKSFVSPKILPPKFNRNVQKPLIGVNRSVGSNSSIASNDSNNSNDSSKKFRPKKADEKVVSLRKGPMRAVIPIDGMARTNNGKLKVTPTRTESTISTYKLKKTSTPINDDGINTVAQSTPSNRGAPYQTSPLSRPNTSFNSSSKILKQKLNYSGSKLPTNKSDYKNKSTSSLKRYSSGEIRKPLNKEKPLVRSYSAGEKMKLSFKRRDGVKDPLLSTINSFGDSNERNASALKENKNRSVVRSSFSKKIGKENMQ